MAASGFIDLHMHTLLSDGELIPAELVRRAQAAGYAGLALTDHADESNLEELVPSLVRTARALAAGTGLIVLAGLEITHVPPAQIAGLVQRARELGAQWIVVHGETPVEPVAPGTNRAAIRAGVDLLAHPGLLTLAEAREARRRGVTLELTSRAGHSLTNGHVARVAGQAGCRLVVNSDAHAPQDLLTPALARKVVAGAGWPAARFTALQAAARRLAQAAQGA